MMVGLVDIASASATVTIRGQAVEVHGVSASSIAHLLGRFPDLRRLFSGRDVAVEDMMAMGGEIVAAVIAAGTGATGDPEAERAADRLSVDEQADLLIEIARVTLPGGVGPFVEKLTGAGGALGVDRLVGEAGPAAAPDTTSAKPSKS
ncbi:MAG: phage pre-tape measure protein [Limimaricola soesokkakensis]|uniref:phage pre-tape measure protein n=1 Tax=Limimaricola soesokkakensis TaxID=1343159 RepID=UPI004059EC04